MLNSIPFNFNFESRIKQLALKSLENFTYSQSSFNLQQKDLSKDDYNAINNELKIYELPEMQCIHIWRKPPNFTQPIHLDIWLWDNEGNYNGDYKKSLNVCNAAINIPVEGIRTMFWYDGMFERYVKLHDIGGRVFPVVMIRWLTEPKQIDQVIMNETRVIRVDLPHNVCTDSTSGVVASLRLKSNPSFDFVLSRLQK